MLILIVIFFRWRIAIEVKELLSHALVGHRPLLLAKDHALKIAGDHGQVTCRRSWP
jgi:hypothetical protein